CNRRAPAPGGHAAERAELLDLGAAAATGANARKAKGSMFSRVAACCVASERNYIPSPLLGIHLLIVRATSQPTHTRVSGQATDRSARLGRVGMSEFAEP